jgi:HEAT repeat protein
MLRPLRCWMVLVGLAVLLLFTQVRGDDPAKSVPPAGAKDSPDEVANEDAQLLRQAGVMLDEAGLLAYLGKGEWSGEGPDVQTLIRLLGSDDFAKREKATEELTRIGRIASRRLHEAAGSDDAEIASRAKKCLKEMEVREKLRSAVFRQFRRLHAIEALSSLLHNKNPILREKAARTLGDFADKANVRVPELIAILGDQDDEVRSEVCDALTKVGTPAGVAVLRALKDRNPRARAGATSVISLLIEQGTENPQRKEWSAQLLTMFDDDSAEVRAATIRSTTLNKALDPRIVVDRFTKLLEDSSVDVRVEAARGLVSRGAASISAIPALVRLLQKRDDEDGSYWAGSALGDIGKAIGAAGDTKIDSGTIVAKIVAALHDTLKDKKVPSVTRRGAAVGLGTIGPKADVALPTLNEICRSLLREDRRDQQFLFWTVRAISEMGKTDDAVVDVLLAVLKDHKASLDARGVAALTFGDMRPPPAAAVHLLDEMSKDRTLPVPLSYQVREARRRIGNQNEK